MEFVICCQTNGHWFWEFALPLTLFASIIPILFVIVCRYIKVQKLLKASLLTFLFAPFLILGFFVTSKLCFQAFQIVIDNQVTFPNLSDWSNNIAVSSNVIGIILLAIVLTSLFLFVLFITKNLKKKSQESS